MVTAILRVKDEFDIIASTIRQTLEQVDHILVADNGSTDGTREILADLPVELIDDPDVGYFQAQAMTALAHRARENGADWILPVDADELWRSREGRLADTLEALPENILIAEADLFDYVATAKDPGVPDPVERIQWRREYAAPLPKVAVRARENLEIHQGNHNADFGRNIAPRVSGLLTVSHFPYRSTDQFVSKVRNGAAAYAATDLPDDIGAHWRNYGRLYDEGGREAIAEVYEKWYFRERPHKPLVIEGEKQGPLVHDPVPPCPSPL